MAQIKVQQPKPKADISKQFEKALSPEEKFLHDQRDKMMGKLLQHAQNQDTTIPVPEDFWEYSMLPTNNRFSVRQEKNMESGGIITPGQLMMNDIEGNLAYRFFKVHKVAENCSLVKPGDVVCIKMSAPTLAVFEFPDFVEYHFFANEVVTKLTPNTKPDNVTIS